jgi:L-amino acid N-acyltransferase YncA
MLSSAKVEIKIRQAKEKDFAEILRIFKKVISSGDTYVNRTKTSKKEIHEKWMSQKVSTFIAEIDKKIVGTYLIKPNQIDRESHIGNASYIVDEKYRGLKNRKNSSLTLHLKSKRIRLQSHAIQLRCFNQQWAVKLW